MEILKETRFIERLQFFNGQRLFASDLQGLEAFNREMRWLHNKSLHQPGIGNGFAITGRKGEREVTIGAGYAIDALGREIVLLESQTEPIPPVAGESDGSPKLYYLTVSYPNDADLEETELREGICDTRGAIRLREQPVFCWVELSQEGQPKDASLKQQILGGMKLVLAQAEILNCQLNKDVSIAQRLSARPSSQPYVCCGMAEARWQPMIIADFSPDNVTSSDEGQAFLKVFGTAITFFPMIAPAGLQMTINTAECGFRTTPCYSARIAGPRVKHITSDDLRELTSDDDSGTPTSGDATAPRKFQASFIVDGLIEIVDPKPDRFTINVLLMGQLLFPDESDQNSLLARMEAALRRDQPTNPTESGKAAATKLADQTEASARFQRILEKIIKKFFSDWTVEWMGVEG